MKSWAPFPYPRGVNPKKFFRNGTPPDAAALQSMGNMVNMIAGRRLKVLWSNWLAGFTSRNATATQLWFGRFRTSCNFSAVRALVLLRATGTAATYTWNVGPAGGALVAQTTRQFITSTGLAALNGLSQAYFDEQVFVDGSGDNLAADTQYDLRLDVSVAGAPILGAIVYEVPKALLDWGSRFAPGTDTCVPVGQVDPIGAPIVDKSITALHDTLWKLWRRQGPMLFSWAHYGGGQARTSATFANVIDDSTAGHSATARGFNTFTRYHHRLTSTTVPVVCWANAKTNTGVGGEVRFVNSAGTIATLTGFGTTQGYVETTATIDGTAAEDLVIVEHRDSGGNTVTTYSAGMYEYLA